MLYKKIHIGEMIKNKVEQLEISEQKVSSYLGITEKELEDCYKKESLDSNMILKFSKILRTDLFRPYSNHLLLYTDLSKEPKGNGKVHHAAGTGISCSKHPKNLYTPEVIAFILSEMTINNLTVRACVEKYNIPKTTIHRWVRKYIE